MEYVGNLVVRIGADLSGFSAGMKAVETKLGTAGVKMAAIGTKLTKGVTVPVVALGAASVFAFAHFDDAMTSSLAIMGDVSDTMKNEMSNAAREVGKTTKFSATEAAEAYFFLASAGLSAEQSIAALPSVAAFAQAGNFDLAQATDLLTDAQSALGLSSDDTVVHMKNMARVSDVLVKANTLANASVEEFSTALTSKLGAALRSMNKPVEEGVAVLSALADQGLKGATAGEALTRVMEELQVKAIKNTSAFDKYGIAVYDTSGNMRNMADVVADVEKATEGMSDETQTAMYSELGLQKRSMATMKQLDGTSESIREYEKDLYSAGGTTKDVADNQMKSFSKQMGLVKDKLVDAGISIGSILAPKLKTLAEWVAKVAEKFSNLPKGLQTGIIGFGLLVAAIGPVLKIGGAVIKLYGGIGRVIGGVGKAITVMQTTSMASLATMQVGFAASFAAIAAAVAGAVIVVGHFREEARKAREEAEKAIDDSAWSTWAGAVSVELKTTLGITGAQAAAIRTGVLDKFQDLPAGATQTFAEMRDGIAARLYETTGITREEAAAQANTLIGKWTDIKNEGGTTFTAARTAIVAQLQQLGVESAEQAGQMADGILAQTAHINKDGVLSFEGTRTEIGTILTTLGITSQEQVDTMSAGILNTMGGLKTDATTTFGAMKSSVTGIMNGLKIEGTEKASLFASETVSEFNTARSQGGDAVAKLKQSIITDMDLLFGVSGEKASAAADAIITNLERGGAEGAQEVRELGTDVETIIGGFDMATPPIITSPDMASVGAALRSIKNAVSGASIVATIKTMFKANPIFDSAVKAGEYLTDKLSEGLGTTEIEINLGGGAGPADALAAQFDALTSAFGGLKAEMDAKPFIEVDLAILSITDNSQAHLDVWHGARQALANAKEEMKKYEEQIEQSQGKIDRLTDRQKALNEVLTKEQGILSDLRGMKITGETLTNKKSFNLQQKSRQIQLQILKAQQKGDKATAERLKLEKERVDKAKEIHDLETAIEYEPQHRALEKLLDPLEDQEMAYKDITREIGRAQRSIAYQERELGKVETAIKKEQSALIKLKVEFDYARTHVQEFANLVESMAQHFLARMRDMQAAAGVTGGAIGGMFPDVGNLSSAGAGASLLGGSSATNTDNTYSIHLHGDQVFPGIRSGRDYDSWANEVTRRAVQSARTEL